MNRRSIALGLVAGLATFSHTQAHAGASYSIESIAADVRVLPDFDPYQSSGIDWFNGNGVGIWSDGYPRIGEPSSFFLNFESVDTVQEYVELGESFASEDNLQAQGNQGSASHQLVSGGSVNFTADEAGIPSSFNNGIKLNRTSPSFFSPLGLTGYSFSGADASFFNLDPADLPASVSGSMFDLDLLFSGTEARDYFAELELQTDTPGLTIPYRITGRVNTRDDNPKPTAVPSPTAAGAGLVMLVGLAARRRRRA